MVKRLEGLSKTQRGIVTILETSEGNAINIADIKTRLEKNNYGNINRMILEMKLVG